MNVAPPTATEAEGQVIGALLIDPTSIGDVGKLLRPADFVDPYHRATFKTISAMHSRREPIDSVSVLHHLRTTDVFADIDYPPAGYLAETGAAVSTVAHVRYHAELVQEAARKRRLHDLASTAAEHALNGRASSEVLADLWAGVEDLRREANGEHDRFTFAELRTQYPDLAEPVVDGLFREGETANLISVSKIGKSWLAYNLALCVITGRPWFDRFDTSRGRALIIDNELPRSVLSHRIPTVAEAMSLFPDDYKNDLDVWSLRGNLRSIQQLAVDLGMVERGQYGLIIFDARYRFQEPGVSENDNSPDFYNTIDHIAEETGAAIVLIHHSTKGGQSEKRVTDVGAGGGVQSRAADCHLILREHEDDGVFVLDAAVRSFAPIEPIALRWCFPLWRPAEDVDPAKLRGKLSANEQRQSERDREGMASITEALGSGPSTARAIRNATGISKDRTERLLTMMLSAGEIKTTETKIRGNQTYEYQLSGSDK